MPNPGLSKDEMLEALRLVSEYGSITEAARVINMNRETLQSRVNKARDAIKTGSLDPDLAERIPEGHRAKGVSTLYDSEGNVRAQWVKTSVDADKAREAQEAAIAAMCAEIPRIAPVAAPQGNLGHLLTLYTFTDYHVGMLAWHKEGGDDWDLQIAEKMGADAMAALVDGAPQSDEAIVNIQGDFLHFDGLLPVTPTHGHVLDADSRFGKVVDVAIRLIRRLVATALGKHRHVTLLIAEGNHDVTASLWLRKLFAALYELEPRVAVHDSELPYYAIPWGQNLIGFHHGHLRGNGQLPALFAAQFRELWGQSKRAYIHTGHRHHKEVKEHPGAEVHQHPTLAARDAYAARGGWWSERKITAITYHATHGEVATNTVTPEMVA